MLSRWERAEVGRALRRLGWTYGEIRQVIAVPKGTVLNWWLGGAPTRGTGRWRGSKLSRRSPSRTVPQASDTLLPGR